MKAGKVGADVDRSIAYTVAQLKGRRLRMVRALTGLSRQELHEKIGIATSTVDTWESGRVELTEKSAERICLALRKVGIYCACEWLLTGAGMPPRTMDDVEKFVFLSDGLATFPEQLTFGRANDKIPPFMDNDMRRELSFFLSLHENSLFHLVEEDSHGFRYRRGDCVAGTESDIQTIAVKIIIAQLVNKKTTLCKLIRTSEEGSDVLLGKGNLRKRLKIARAAQILWHRRSYHKR
ncbi:MAG: helix-turn-helix transcriptional regulator [Holosporaceae bacterium]|jgi:transcriptional regulator with XRE-family HTH domain|nr:helix-turn-helix transcriptional regulator [Holosporaceae bacterium]